MTTYTLRFPDLAEKDLTCLPAKIVVRIRQRIDAYP